MARTSTRAPGGDPRALSCADVCVVCGRVEPRLGSSVGDGRFSGALFDERLRCPVSPF